MANTITAHQRHVINKAWTKLLHEAGFPNGLDLPLTETMAAAGAIATIADGAQLHGYYDGSVLVLGSATLTDDVVVHGSVYVLNDLNNPDGKELVVLGDLLVSGTLNWTTTSQDTEQSDMYVFGNFQYTYVDWQVNKCNSPWLNVSGDLINIDYDDFDGYGRCRAAGGLNVWVGGNLIADYMDLHGADASSSHSAGDGGQLYVDGDATFYDGFDCYGGDTSHDSKHAGDGGYIEAEGDLVGYVNLDGGDSNANANAGDAGECNVYGTFTNYWFEATGGNCSAASGCHSAGQGGYLFANEIIADSSIILNGGRRTGTLTDTNTSNVPYGGYVEVDGDMLVSWVELKGGTNCATYSAAESDQITFSAGNSYAQGDFLFITDINNGTFAFWADIDSDGTEPSGTIYTGAGTKVKVSVSSTADAPTTTAQWGAALTTNLTGLTVAVVSSTAYSVTQTTDGAVTVAQSYTADEGAGSAGIGLEQLVAGHDTQSNSAGGDGGGIDVKGDLTAYELNLRAGSATGRCGGAGGRITTKGRLHCSHKITLNGGDSDSMNGSAGYLAAKDGMLCQLLFMKDGCGDGTSPDNTTGLYISGSNHITTLNAPDRTSFQIKPYGNQNKASLQVGEMCDKGSLTQPDDSDTVAISGDVQESIFLYDPNGGWYKVSGSSLGAG